MRICSHIVKSYVIIPALVVVCLLFDNTAYAETQQMRNVLVINSFHPTKRWTRLTVEGIESTLEQYEGIIGLDVEYMDTEDFDDERYYQNLFNLYKHKAEHKKYDVIVACGYNALFFILQHRDKLYPGVPVVFCKITYLNVPTDDYKFVTGVTMEETFEPVVETALGFHPSARQVVVLVEQRFAPGLVERIETLAAKFKHRAKFITYVLSNPTAEELVSKFKGLGQESIVVFTAKFTDTAQLDVFDGLETEIERQCRAPIYALSDLWFSHAPVVGGRFSGGLYHGQAAAELVIRILDGESADEILIQRGHGDKYIFDYAQLKRFKIPFSKLPEGSVIINEPATFYHLYKKRIWTTVAVIISLTVIAVILLKNILRRRLVEKKLLDRQSQLKSLASQLSLTEERERRRIAMALHDQIGQSLVISKVQLDELRESTSADERYNVLDDVSKSLDQTIQSTKSLTFDLSSPILQELGFEKAVADWLAEQIEKEHGIVSEFESDGQPKPLDDDICVLLFRDVRELLVNVVKHSGASKVKIFSQRVDNEIKVAVEDNGVGFKPAGLRSAATKSSALGLFSIRERLEQVGGRLEIESKPGYGTKITVIAPLKKQD